jgi:subtilisin family serine protease
MVGAAVTQGDRAIRATLARRWFGLDGQGITIGIISDSFNVLRAARRDVRQGDLPGLSNPNGYIRPVRVLQDAVFGSDEGRALAQIIHDIAPGAELLFHTTGNTEQDFATAVRSLTHAGANIIVDDILFATSTFFQDGIPAQAVDEATRRGVVYVTAAGNNGDRSYESPFRAGPQFTFRGSTYEAHDFDTGTGVDLFQDIRIPTGNAIDLILNWDQASGQVETDLELFLLDRPQLPGTGSRVLDEGTLLRGREADPARRVGYRPLRSEETVYLMIARRIEGNGTAPNTLKWISFANNRDNRTSYQYISDGMGSSTIYGHQNAAGAITVGAVPFRQTPAYGNRALSLERYSSTGGVGILFDAQGNRLTSPDVRQKPNILAPTRVKTTVAGFRSFFGTSAAAPHVAALAALMLQRAGGHGRLTPAQILAALRSGTIPLSIVPNNFPDGVGLVQANAAVLRASLNEIMGTEADDRLLGTEAADNLAGRGGNDQLFGGNGFDALFGEAGNDRLQGDGGNDYLLGQAGHDRLIGGRGRDWLNGGVGADKLRGDGGNDVLRGGTGRNQAVGGNGRDLFILDRNGRMKIADFQPQRDRLGLPTGLPLSQLSIEQNKHSTLIKGFEQTLAILSGIRSDQITVADFVTV